MKRVMIIGATSAIAGACAREWARRGARLFLVARDGEKLHTIAGDLIVRGTDVSVTLLDVEDMERYPIVLAEATAFLGGIDIVLIAHGSLPSQEQCERDVRYAVKEFTINATSVIALMTVIANHLLAQGYGAIGVISSVAGVRGRASNYLYGSAKATVSAFCEGLRVRLHRQRISVTDIRPGFIESPMTAHLPLPKVLVVSPNSIARRMICAIESGTPVVYVPTFWALIMFIIRHLPSWLFTRLKL